MVESPVSPYVPALRKGLSLLELLAEHGQMTLAQVEHASGLNRTMAYRLLRVMDELGYVSHDPVHHQYGLGFRLLGLGAAAASRLDLSEMAWPLLDAARQDPEETAILAVLVGNQIVHLGMLHGAPGSAWASRLAGRHAPHATAVGKAILAFLPRQRRQTSIAVLELTRLTPSTIVDTQTLEQELVRTREQEYALEDEEHAIGMRSVAVPVLDLQGYPLAAIALSGPAEQFDLALAAQKASRLWTASRELSRQVGHAQGWLAS